MTNLRSFRTRISLWNMAVIALVLGGFGTLLIYGVNIAVANSIDADLRQRVMPLLNAPPGAPGGPPGGPGPPAFNGPAPPPMPHENMPMRIINPDGIVENGGPGVGPWDVAAFRESLDGKEVYKTISQNGESLRVFSGPRRSGFDIVGVVQVARGLSDFQLLRAGQFRALLMLVPLALLIAGIGGLFLASRALKPVEEVTNAAAAINASDLSKRLAVFGEDELARMSATFNAMLDRLQESFHSRAEAYAQLHEAFEQQKRFTADASHELRTPLARIKLSASAALNTEQSGEEYRRALRITDTAADAMDRLIRQLLILARADAGALEIKREAIDIKGFMDEIRRHWTHQQSPPLVFDFPDMAVTASMDKDYLARALDNLIENAIRHTTAVGKIVISARIQNDFLILTVADTGEGIAPEHLPHLFERFYRVDSARTRESGGTGLGLAICKSIAEAHGGTIDVESCPGEGTTVILKIPSQHPAERQ